MYTTINVVNVYIRIELYHSADCHHTYIFTYLFFSLNSGCFVTYQVPLWPKQWKRLQKLKLFRLLYLLVTFSLPYCCTWRALITYNNIYVLFCYRSHDYDNAYCHIRYFHKLLLLFQSSVYCYTSNISMTRKEYITNNMKIGNKV